jgi:hypothetical protein
MSNLKLIVVVLVMVGLGWVLALQYTFNERLRQDNDALRGAIAELKQSQDTREPAAADDAWTKEQLAELLTLRSEVTQLRGQTNQIAALAETNKKLLSSVKELGSSRTNASTKKSPPDVLPQDIHPRETWAYRGFGTPDATMESVLSAMIAGDKATCLAGFIPEMQAEIEKDFDSAVQDARTDDKAEFRILDRQALSDDEMVLNVYLSRKDAHGNIEEHSEKTVFDRIGGEWKVTKKKPPEN